MSDRVCLKVLRALLRRVAKRAQRGPAVPAVRSAGSGRACHQNRRRS